MTVILKVVFLATLLSGCHAFVPSCGKPVDDQGYTHGFRCAINYHSTF